MDDFETALDALHSDRPRLVTSRHLSQREATAGTDGKTMHFEAASTDQDIHDIGDDFSVRDVEVA